MGIFIRIVRRCVWARCSSCVQKGRGRPGSIGYVAVCGKVQVGSVQLADIRHGRRGGRMRFSLLIDREEGFLHSGGHLSLLIQSVCICQVEIAGCEIFGENIGLIALQEETVLRKQFLRGTSVRRRPFRSIAADHRSGTPRQMRIRRNIRLHRPCRHRSSACRRRYRDAQTVVGHAVDGDRTLHRAKTSPPGASVLKGWEM